MSGTMGPRTVREIFTEALDVPEAQRAEFLEHACAGNQELRAKVESMLGALAQAGDFLAAPTAAATTGADAVRAALSMARQAVEGAPGSVDFRAPAGSSIGPYKLMELIGE